MIINFVSNIVFYKNKKQDLVHLIDAVLLDLEKTKFISDKFYSETKAKNLIQKGSSINKIRNYLISKGINNKYIKETINKINENNENQDFFSAIKICKKKRIGPSRPDDNRPLFYKKDISILARNGFDFETSKKVMDLDKDEYLKIVNLLWFFIFIFFFKVVMNFVFNIVFNKNKNN